jgi:hypothetical protein
MNSKNRRHLVDIIGSIIQDLKINNSAFKNDLRAEILANGDVSNAFLKKYYNIIMSFFIERPRVPNLQNSNIEYFFNMRSVVENLPNDSGQIIVLQPVYQYPG